MGVCGEHFFSVHKKPYAQRDQMQRKNLQTLRAIRCAERVPLFNRIQWKRGSSSIHKGGGGCAIALPLLVCLKYCWMSQYMKKMGMNATRNHGKTQQMRIRVESTAARHESHDSRDDGRYWSTWKWE